MSDNQVPTPTPAAVNEETSQVQEVQRPSSAVWGQMGITMQDFARFYNINRIYNGHPPFPILDDNILPSFTPTPVSSTENIEDSIPGST